MEVFQFLGRWEIKIDEIFPGDKNKGKIDDLTHLIRKLGHLMEKKIRTWWDLISFEQYIANDLVPRRLGWYIPLMMD